ncbi:S9 family peptidase [Spirosoma sp. KNUC1025]|uniref:alpha/beta hydrolase family protein n=1 Tax=Spirosoma sp. KNUC1025 TaxID=2894082 RepID=UPI003866014E|nr:prolyl oligopeptidase family serine peptidase [Spirosoma sp. KNUC1025]
MIPPKTIRLWHQVCISLLLPLFLFSCSNLLVEDHAPIQTYLVSSTKVTDVPLQSLSAVVGQTNPAYLPLLKYSISAYRIVYKTQNWDGKTINASGLLLIPATTDPVPMISQQHGTIFNDAEAPSYFGPASEAFQFSSIFSSNGYIIACPDYIGFGESKSQIHPYEYRATQAQTCLDMLRAAREYINANAAIKWDSRLYLAGYSEGGYATMALYKKMQEEVPFEFNLKAVSAGAGAYDKTNFTKALLAQPSAGNPNWNRAFLWVLFTYNTIYSDLRRPMDYYFKEPYLTDVKTNGLAANLNVSIDQTFTDAFKLGVLSGTDTAFLKALADNDIYNWKPLIPLLLTHGTADQQVFPLNTASASTAMAAQGSTVVTVYPVAGKTHVETIPYWLDATYTLFKTIL